VPRTASPRVSSANVLAELRRAARRGDRAALTLAVEQMKVLALSPRYWEKYLALLANPLARLVDLLVIKQGDRIGRQRGWKVPATPRAPRRGGGKQRPARLARRRRPPVPTQPSLFPDADA
jgi:hypothetical protein